MELGSRRYIQMGTTSRRILLETTRRSLSSLRGCLMRADFQSKPTRLNILWKIHLVTTQKQLRQSIQICKGRWCLRWQILLHHFEFEPQHPNKMSQPQLLELPALALSLAQVLLRPNVKTGARMLLGPLIPPRSAQYHPVALVLLHPTSVKPQRLPVQWPAVLLRAMFIASS